MLLISKNLMMHSKRLSRFSNLSCLKQIYGEDYDGAVQALNKLISNAEYLRHFPDSGSVNFGRHKKYFERSGISWKHLDELSVIHVAGTKGKGSTCSLCESMLRFNGYRTGFFSSPHLIDVCERIRINGKPIAQNKFASHFWNLFDVLETQMNDQNDMPTYFNFLTLMAFKVFLEENVDVAIIEVGIGGEYDCTNILRNVDVVGITSLGYDHVDILGNTMESIAWNKAGIMKPNSMAFTVPQPPDAMEILKKRSKERNCSLNVIDIMKLDDCVSEKMPKSVFESNLSLAAALTNCWMTLRGKNCVKNSNISPELISFAIESWNWPGRFDYIKSNNINFYLDGAHTIESVAVCSQWFAEKTKNSRNEKVLMFNVTGCRNAEQFLKLLSICGFQKIIFVSNVANKKTPTDAAMNRCNTHKQIWMNNFKSGEVYVASTIQDALDTLDSSTEHDLLITGSLHLVGAALESIKPNLF